MIAAEQIDRKILNATLEYPGKNHGHYDHDQQRIQDTPDVSEKASAVFQLDILQDQQFLKISVVPEIMDILQQFVPFVRHKHSNLYSWY